MSTGNPSNGATGMLLTPTRSGGAARYCTKLSKMNSPKGAVWLRTWLPKTTAGKRSRRRRSNTCSRQLAADKGTSLRSLLNRTSIPWKSPRQIAIVGTGAVSGSGALRTKVCGESPVRTGDRDPQEGDVADCHGEGTCDGSGTDRGCDSVTGNLCSQAVWTLKEVN